MASLPLDSPAAACSILLPTRSSPTGSDTIDVPVSSAPPSNPPAVPHHCTAVMASYKDCSNGDSNGHYLETEEIVSMIHTAYEASLSLLLHPLMTQNGSLDG